MSQTWFVRYQPGRNEHPKRLIIISKSVFLALECSFATNIPTSTTLDGHKPSSPKKSFGLSRLRRYGVEVVPLPRYPSRPRESTTRAGIEVTLRAITPRHPTRNHPGGAVEVVPRAPYLLAPPHRPAGHRLKIIPGTALPYPACRFSAFAIVIALRAIRPRNKPCRHPRLGVEVIPVTPYLPTPADAGPRSGVQLVGPSSGVLPAADGRPVAAEEAPRAISPGNPSSLQGI